MRRRCRWSNCTAPCVIVAATINGDVISRGAMLALQIERIEVLVGQENWPSGSASISAIHCRVSLVIAEARPA